MTATTIALLVLFCTGASFVQRVSGFGFGIFIMTMLPYLMPSYGEATTLSGMLSAAQSLYVLFSLYRLISWKRLLPILITFLIVSYFAVRLVASMTDSHLRLALGVVLLLMSFYFMFINKRVHLNPSIFMQVSMGTLSGVMGGLFGTQGPPAVLFFMATETDKERYLAIAQAYFLIGNLCMTVYRAQNGFLTTVVWRAWFYALIGVVIGSILGKFVFDKISTDVLRKVVYIYVAISGVIAIFA